MPRTLRAAAASQMRDALGVPRFSGNDFKRGVNDELVNQGKPKVAFGSGIWQVVGSRTLENRNSYTHMGVQITDRFPPISHAEDAIEDVRSAVREIYRLAGKMAPAWIELNGSNGWPSSGSGMVGTPTIVRQGADPNDPGTIKIALITTAGQEQPIEYLQSSTADQDIFGAVEDLLGKLNVPFAGIRVYRGSALIHDESIEVQG